MKKVVIALSFEVEDKVDEQTLNEWVSGTLDNADYSVLEEELGTEVDVPMNYLERVEPIGLEADNSTPDLDLK